MTEKLFYNDNFATQFTATVIDCYQKADGYFMVLDRTAFFPEGGGQASDVGYINELRLINPDLADQALLCLEMMNFEGKEEISEKGRKGELAEKELKNGHARNTYAKSCHKHKQHVSEK